MEKIRFGRDIIIETNVIEADGRVVDRWKVTKNDYPFCVKTIANKHGIDMVIVDKRKNKEDKDFDWAL